MSNFLQKIPVSPITSFGNPSVPIGSTFGTNFSILQTGGYMEVYSLSGLTFTIPSNTTGIIEFSGNSIPIQFTKGSGSIFSPDVLTLNSDNISSGRRKLGMLAYVYETNKIYQFKIDNYDTLWNNATGATGPGGPTVVISDFGTTVKNNSASGIAFINAWTSSTISGVGGYDDTTTSWRVLQTGGSSSGGGTTITGGTFDNSTDTLTLNNSTGTVTITGFTDIFVTGGTYSNGTTTFTNNTGGTFTVSGYFTGQTDNSITGGTFNNNTDTLTLNNSTGGTVTITGFTDYYTTGFTFNPSTYDLTIQRNDGLPNLLVNLSILASDVTITGGTYNSSTGTATFTNNTGGTFNVTGFLTGFTDIYVTGGTFNKNTSTLTLTRNDNTNIPVTGFTDVFVTGATKSGSVATFRNNTGGTFTLTGLTDVFVTGATKSGTVATFRNNTGGTFTLTGLTDTFVTGGTYNSSTGTATFRNNTGGTFGVNGFFTSSDDIYVTGGTIGNGPDTANNKITLNRTDGNIVVLLDLVNIVNLSKSDMDTTISIGKVIRGKTYRISKCDPNLYYNGTDKGGDNVYTDVYLMGLENNKLSETGIGVFYTPKYSDYSIFVDNDNYTEGQEVIWGGYIWKCKQDGRFSSVDDFTLPVQFGIIYPFEDDDSYNTQYYKISYDDVIYDIDNDKIIYRNEQNSNIVSTTVENREYWENLFDYGPIKYFQWGNVFILRGGGSGIGNQRIINSLNNNINYTGIYQIDFYFSNLSYQTNVLCESGAYQKSLYFENGSYQSTVSISEQSYQEYLYFTNGSYQSEVSLKSSSYQSKIELYNDSYQEKLSIDNVSHQKTLFFYNGCYQSDIYLRATGTKQEFFNFNNQSYQTNINFNDSGSSQANFHFDNASYQNVIQFNGSDNYQSDFNFDNASYQDSISLGYESYQTRLNFNNVSYQSGISIQNGCYQVSFNFDNNSYQSGINLMPAGQETGQRFFNFTNDSYQYLVDVDNVTQYYFEFNSGNQNNSYVGYSQFKLVIEHGSQTGNPPNNQDTVTIKGYDLDWNTYPGTVDTDRYLIHDLPTEDTNVLIGKKDNQLIQVSNLVFDGGITANTISASTYQNLPIDIRVTGGTYSNGTAIFTNNTGGTFNVTGFPTATGGTTNYYGSFSDTTNQTVSGASTSTVWRYNTTEISNGIVIENNTRIKVSHDGIYEIGYSAQIEKTQGGTASDVTIWAEINGVKVDRSSSTTTLVSNSSYQLPFVSYIFNLNAGDYVEFYFSSPSEHVQLTTLSGLTSPTRPVSPSVIIVAKAIGNAVLNNSGDTYVTGFTLNGTNLDLTQNRLGTYSGFSVNLPFLPLTGGTLTGSLTAPTYFGDGSNLTGVSRGGGGGGQLYYFNISQTQSPYYEFSTTATTSTEQTISATTAGNTTVLVGGFMTPSTLPNITNLPAGILSFYLHTYDGSTNHSFNIYCELYKRTTGGTETLLFTSDSATVIGNTVGMVICDGYFSGASFNTSDRIVVKVYGQNITNQTRTIYLVSEGSSHYSFAFTTIPTSTDTYVTGATKSGSVATFTNNFGGTFTLTGLTDTFVTGGTYDSGVSTITFTNNTGGTFNVTGITASGGSFTGGTVSGATNFTNGLTANTISATTYQNLPISGLTQGTNITITNDGFGNFTISSTGGSSSGLTYGLVVATSLGYQNIF